MPRLAKRRYAPRRKLITRHRMARLLRHRRGMMGRSIPQPVQYFKRSVYLSGHILTSVTSDTFTNQFFSLSSVPNYTEFTNLYDQYRINGVKVTLLPRGNTAEITASSGASTVFQGQSTGVFSVIDYDDTAVLSSIQQACEYQNMKMTRATQQHSRYLKPRFNLLSITNQGTGATGASQNTRGWLDCDYINVPHYGVKWAFQQNVNYNLTYDVKIDYYLAFKNVR